MECNTRTPIARIQILLRLAESALKSPISEFDCVVALLSERVFAGREDFCRERTQGTHRKEVTSLRSLRSFVAIILGCGYAALKPCVKKVSIRILLRLCGSALKHLEKFDCGSSALRLAACHK